jgi:hypothetical protein
MRTCKIDSTAKIARLLAEVRKQGKVMRSAPRTGHQRLTWIAPQFKNGPAR